MNIGFRTLQRSVLLLGLVYSLGLSAADIAPVAWRGSWSAVSGASYYIYRTTNPNSGNETNETSTSAVKNYFCSWVKACNLSIICSSKTYF